ncbi:MAG TPA: ferritin-like domain-containing protein [Bryobacteraceae bacterium]|nr:ferritin-like domain-containing protein [Bryobacteraceae bacterium]
MHVEQLTELLIEEIKDIYHAEKQLVAALPKMAKAVENPDLQEAITAHLSETKDQVTRLEQVFSLLGTPAKAKPCKGMQGLIAEGDEAAGEIEEGFLRDLAIIGAAQRIEHYEIAAYGTARAIADQIVNADVSELLAQTGKEEETADKLLTKIALKIYKTAGQEHEAERSGNGKKKSMAAKT